MKQYLLIPFLALGIFCSSPSLSAQNQHPEQTAPTEHTVPLINDHLNDHLYDIKTDPGVTEDDFQAKFMNMLFVLALLVGFMILASIMLKRMTRSRLTQMNTKSIIKVVEARSLSPRATLYLIEIEGKEILVAESHAGITNLGRMNES